MSAHVLAAAMQVHETAKYIPMTAYDKQTAEEGGIVAVATVVLGLLVNLVRGGKKAASASK